MTLADALLNWYDLHRRMLPWRGTRDPYRIWLSEIMLQQTRTETVARYYQRFLAAFPTVGDLAHADEDAVLKLWEGLGYYSRARNLHAAAKRVADEMRGRFNGIFQMLNILGGIIGQLAAGAVGELLPARPVVLAAMALNIVCVLFVMLPGGAHVKKIYNVDV